MFDLLETERLREVMEREYRRFSECETCDHKGESHYANCIECCPVRRRISAERTRSSAQ